MCKVRFLIGSPRSGKSISSDVLNSNGNFAWISQFASYLPNNELLNLLNLIYSFPTLGLKLYSLKNNNLVLPTHSQADKFWTTHLQNFKQDRGKNGIDPKKRSSPSIRQSDDISVEETKNIKEIIWKICKWQKKNSFLGDYAEYPRMTYFSQPFPQSKFVHVIRDGKAVAYEYSKANTLGNYIAYKERKWWVKGWPNEWKEEYLKNYNDSALAFCAYQWKFFLKLIWKDAERISSDRYKEVKYKDIVERPKEIFKDILDFFGVEYNDRIDWYIDQKDFKNMNYKWKEELNGKQKRMLDEIIHEPQYVELLDPNV